MKFIYTELLVGILFFFISSCQRSPDYSKLELISKGIIEIQIDEQTSNNWWMMETIKLNGEEFLVYHDLIQSDPKFIHFANLRDSQKSFKIPLSIEGPNGIGRLDGFHVRNLDSIFVLNKYQYQLYLVDSSGTVNETYQLRADGSNVPAADSALPNVWHFSPMIDLGNKLIIPSLSDNEAYNNQYLEEKQVILLDLESKKIEYQLGFSNKYFNSGFWGVLLEMPSYTINYKDSLIIQSFPIDDQLLVFDYDLNLVKSPSLFQELYLDRFHSLPNFESERDIFYPHIYSNPSNKAIVHDPYRNLYYRIMVGPYSAEGISKLMEIPRKRVPNNEGPDLIIMVLDETFKELGVINVNKNIYWLDRINVIEDGIVIQVQTEDENKNTFEIFEVKL